MRHFLFLLPLLIIGCSTPHTITTIRQIDSLVMRDSIVYVELPIERVVDVVPQYDTLHLSTTVASASAWVDTTLHILQGSITTSDVPIKTTIQYVERFHIRDSIITQEVPVEVVREVTRIPKSYWWFLGFTILSILLFIYKVFIQVGQ